MKSFDVKSEAESWLRLQDILLANQGHAAFTMTDDERMDAVKAREALKTVTDLPRLARLETVARTYTDAWTRLAGVGATILQAVDFLLKHRPKNGEKRTVSEAAAEYLQDAKDNNLRPTTIRDFGYRLRRLKTFCGTRPVAEITRDDGDKWLQSMPLASGSKKKYRIIAHGLFNYCIDKGYYSAENPFTTKRHRRKYHEDETLPDCMPWGDVQKIMAAAAEYEPSMIPALSVGFFAGLRTNELRQLDWSQVDLVAGRITVLATVAKKRRTRHVTIEPNLAAWLTPHLQEHGLMAPVGEKWRSRLDTVRGKADIKWPHNSMRHSFASNHLVRYGDAARTAFQLGHHADTTMLFDHYRALITKEDAEAYWKIMPAEMPVVLQLPIVRAG